MPKKGRKIVQARKKVVDGIEFASTLEAYMYSLLKANGMNFDYEGKVYKILLPFEYQEECWERATRKSKAMIDRPKVREAKYTPDFVGENEEWVIEVKGRANERFPMVWKLFKKLLTDREQKEPILFKPMNQEDCKQVIEILKSKGYGKSKS
jgi:hypothetical protein